MRRYESYKDSGVEWLGKIPSHWDLTIGMNVFRENKRDNKGMKEKTVLSLSYGQIIIKPEEKLVGLVPESFETYQIVEPNDIIIRCTDLQNDQTSLRTGLAKDKGIITSAYLNLKVINNHSAKFLHYYLHALDITKVLYKFGSGLRQNLSFLDFKRLPIIDIPLSEQQKIAQFLDDKTAKIDQAVDWAEKQIALLKEHKQILIQNAVTRGLNPDVPLKDSGVEWIGQVPEHWEVKKLKYLGNAIIGLTYSPDDLCDESEGILVARSSNIQNGSFVYSDNVYVKKQIPKKLQLKEQDILICSRNGSRDLIGKCAYITKDQEKHTFGAFTTVFRSKYNPYLFYILNSEIFKRLSGSFLTSTINQLTINNLNSIQVALPPLLEQKKIANCLEVQTAY